MVKHHNPLSTRSAQNESAMTAHNLFPGPLRVMPINPKIAEHTIKVVKAQVRYWGPRLVNLLIAADATKATSKQINAA
jgi:hypothetical protein